MTPETRDAALEGLRFEIRALKPGQRVGYWKLMDLFDQGDSDLSHALDAELNHLAKAGELVFLKDDEGSDSIIERRTPVVKKAPAKKKKKKKAPAKKAKKAKKKR